MPVSLRIKQPAHGRVFVGEDASEVVFEGEEIGRDAVSAGVPMYYRWYSNHHATAARYSLHDAPLTHADGIIRRRLCVGTHVITFAAMNRPSDRPGVFETVTDGGVTGGAGGAGSCVIHVIDAGFRTVERIRAGAVVRAVERGTRRAPLALMPGDTLRVGAFAPLMWKYFEPGFEDIRFDLALAHSAPLGPIATHNFGPFEYVDEDGADRTMEDQMAQWSVTIPDFGVPAPPWVGPAGGIGLYTHPYDRLRLTVWHVAHPERSASTELAITLEKEMP